MSVPTVRRQSTSITIVSPVTFLYRPACYVEGSRFVVRMVSRFQPPYPPMRPTTISVLPRLALLVTSLVLLLAAVFLGTRPQPRFDARDAGVAKIERGEAHMPAPLMAHEWRTEIAAQQFILQQDRQVGGVLAGAGALALIGFLIGERARSRATVAA